jgi:hypothetical protein
MQYQFKRHQLRLRETTIVVEIRRRMEIALPQYFLSVKSDKKTTPESL